MPSNADHIKTITELAEKLGRTVETEGLSNAQLGETVTQLRGEVEAAAAKAKAEADEAAAAKAKAKPSKPPYYVAPRKAITSRKGILSGDTADEVKAEYLYDGEKSLAALVESGHVIKS